MYNKFYGFKKKPFQIVPNPAFLYKSKKHINALTYIEYGIKERIGFILLTGEVGSGKTTLIQYLLSKLNDRFDPAVIFNTQVTENELLAMILGEFELEATGNKATDLKNLKQFLIDSYGAGKNAILIIDEAQNLSKEALEEVRMLSNLHTNTHSLLQIMLVGQPELVNKLKHPSLKQFSQRIAASYHLTGISKEETGEYIAYRVQKAGGRADLFTPAAAELIYKISGGIPRLINLACQAALVYGLVDEAKMIDQDIIRKIRKDKIGISLATSNGQKKAAQPMFLPSMAQSAPELQNGLKKRLDRLENNLKNIRDAVQKYLIQIEKSLKASQNEKMTQLHELYQNEQQKKYRFGSGTRSIKAKISSITSDV